MWLLQPWKDRLDVYCLQQLTVFTSFETGWPCSHFWKLSSKKWKRSLIYIHVVKYFNIVIMASCLKSRPVEKRFLILYEICSNIAPMNWSCTDLRHVTVAIVEIHLKINSFCYWQKLLNCILNKNFCFHMVLLTDLVDELCFVYIMKIDKLF